MPTGIEAERLKQAMGAWLGELAPWDVFSTWTFERPVNEGGAMYWARRHLRWVEKAAALPVYAFVGVERGDQGGLLHVHALEGNVGHLKAECGDKRMYGVGCWGVPCCLKHGWPAGIARVLPYDPQLGAAFYVSKYISKRLAEWDLVGFPARPQISLDLAPGQVYKGIRVAEKRKYGSNPGSE